MSEEKSTRNIQWLCPRCYERFRDTPREKQPNRKKYSIWEAGRWQKAGSCYLCGNWTQLTMYEWEDAEAKENRARRQAFRERGGMPKKDTRARYRAWESET